MNSTRVADAQQITDRLRVARHARRLSQEEAALLSGLHQPQVSRIERGQIASPTFADVAVLARVLGVSLDALADPNPTRFLAEVARVGDRAEGAVPSGQTSLSVIADPYQISDGLLPLGVGIDAVGSPEVLGMSLTELERPLVCVGQVGTGKTELMRWLSTSAAQAGGPVVVFLNESASKSQTLATLLEHCPQRSDDLVWIDLADRGAHLVFNPLAVRDAAEVQHAVLTISQALRAQMQVTADAAPRAFVFFEQALLTLCQANLKLSAAEQHTLGEVERFFADADFRYQVVKQVGSPLPNQVFGVVGDAESAHNGQTGSFERLSAAQQEQYLAPVMKSWLLLCRDWGLLAGSSQSLDFQALLRQNKVIVISGQSYAAGLPSFIGRLLLDQLLRSFHASRGDYPSPRCCLLIDEAHYLLTPECPALAERLLQHHGQDLQLMLFSLSLEALSALPEIEKTALLAFRLHEHDAQLLEERSDGAFSAHELRSLPQHQLLVKADSGPAHQLTALPPLSASPSPEQRSQLEEIKRRPPMN